METKQITKVLLWVIECFYSRLTRDHRFVHEFISKLNALVETRGVLDTCRAVKTARLALTRYVAGTPMDSPCGVKLTGDGLPRLLPKELRVLVREHNPRGTSLALTLLSVTRCVLGGLPVDTTPLVKPTNARIEFLLPYIGRFFQAHGIKPFSPTWSKCHWTTKAGPGGMAIVSALQDFRNLPKALRADIELLGGRALARHLATLDGLFSRVGQALQEIFPFRSNRIRKISVKPDREGKSRLFALLDYYSQTALKPVHDQVFQILKRFPADRTWVQGSGSHSIHPSPRYHSLDLSNATDRFPMSLQREVMSYLIGKKRAAAWERILTQLPFDLNGQPVFYKAGQPMGAYSSWAVFTLCHHFIVWVAAELSGKPQGWANYLLLGDDIVLGDEHVAENYRGILQLLDVPISEAKSHVSYDTYEFAKRWWHRGVEVTPFPLHGLMEVATKYYLLPGFFRELVHKGFDVTPLLSGPGLVRKLLSIYVGSRPRLLETLTYRYQIVASMPVAGSGPDEVYNCAKRFIQLIGVHFSCHWKPRTVIRLFEDYAWAVSRDMLRRGLLKFLKDRDKWLCHLSRAERDLGSPGSDDQSELDSSPSESIANAIPVIAALSERLEEATSRFDSMDGVDLGTGSIWDFASLFEPIPGPNAQGLLPERRTHRISRSTAAWALTLAKQ